MTHHLSERQMAGQRLMVGFDGATFNQDLEFLIRNLNVGGIILFAGNIQTPDQLLHLCSSVQAFARSSGLPPLFIAIDQEGGTVARLKKPLFKEFPGIPSLNNQSATVAFAKDMASQLSELGINMNMAPVMDVAPEGIHSIMEKRIFGTNPQLVSEMGRIIIREHQKQNIMAVAKHFPGIGRTTLDSHLDMPELAVTENDLESFDLIPFKAAVDADVAGMMLSHIRYTEIDADWPASLSPAIARDLLRNRLGYQGIVMTDDLDMGAIQKHYDIHTAIRQILISDVDLALICHKGPDIERAFNEIYRSILNDTKCKEECRKSAGRVMAYKHKYLQPPGFPNP